MRGKDIIYTLENCQSVGGITNLDTNSKVVRFVGLFKLFHCFVFRLSNIRTIITQTKLIYLFLLKFCERIFLRLCPVKTDFILFRMYYYSYTRITKRCETIINGSVRPTGFLQIKIPRTKSPRDSKNNLKPLTLFSRDIFTNHILGKFV